MTLLRTAFFAKNVPSWERVLRAALALVITLFSLTLLDGAWRWPVAASALAFGLTGLVGFCPACALVGRRSPRRE